MFTQHFYDPTKIMFFHLDSIYTMNGIVQKWHQPTKHPSVLVPQMPWEGDMIIPESMYPTPDGRQLMCAYRSHHHPTRFPELVQAGLRVTSCRAISTDGFHWDRTQLGLTEFRGSKQNNLVPESGYRYRPMFDPAESDPQKRYKGIALCWPSETGVMHIEEGRESRCFYSATSPDSIHWSKPTMMAGFEETGDTDCLTYDERQKRYLFTTRKRGYWLSDAFPAFYKHPLKKGMPDGRWVALSTSSDFIQWSPLDNILVRDPMDELGVDFYNASLFPYGDLYLGLLRIHHFWHGLMETELVWSRDSLRWNRAYARRPFLSWGELGDPDWCFGDIIGCKPVRCGNQILMCYETRNHVHAPYGNKGPRGWQGMDGQMGMASLRADGFVSLESGRMGGELTTEPIPAAGQRLIANLRTVRDGVIEIQFLGTNLKPLDAKPIVFRGDQVDFPLEFNGKDTIPHTPDGKIRLNIFLQSAAIYSLRIQSAE